MVHQDVWEWYQHAEHDVAVFGGHCWDKNAEGALQVVRSKVSGAAQEVEAAHERDLWAARQDPKRSRQAIDHAGTKIRAPQPEVTGPAGD